MEKLKNIYNPDSIRAFTKSIKLAYPSFNQKHFCETAIRALPPLELKERVKMLAKLLAENLPKDPAQTFPIILNSIKTDKNPTGIEGFMAWPLTQLVEDIGLDFPSLSLPALKELTKVMSAEFAIRPFLLKYTSSTLAVLGQWAKDENVHVRRLVSEGTRPLLPWGQRIPLFHRDPQICLPLLKELRLDESQYVKKSVANHLNDFSKAHGDWLVNELSKWKKEFPNHQGIHWIIRHALRSLIKSGHAGALALMGFSPAKIIDPRIRISPRRIKIGSALEIHFMAATHLPSQWLIDYAVHHQKKSGELKPKMFKWTKKSLNSKEILSIIKNHRITKISTRKYYQGKHLIEVFVNGRSVGKKEFYLSL